MAWWCPHVENSITTAAPCLLPPRLRSLQLEPTRAHLPRKNIDGCPSPALVPALLPTPLFPSNAVSFCRLASVFLKRSARNVSIKLTGQLKWSLYACVCVFSAGFPTDQRNGDKEFVIRRAATNRVLNVLRHWVSKHSPVKHHNMVFGGMVVFIVARGTASLNHWIERVGAFAQWMQNRWASLESERVEWANVWTLHLRYKVATWVHWEKTVLTGSSERLQRVLVQM